MSSAAPTSSSEGLSGRIARLFVYPVKSCAGVEVTEAVLTPTGLDLDRAWMVVDERGEFLSQRELPRMALIKVQLKQHEVVLRAPGMLALHLAIDAVEEPARVKLWGDEVPAYDMGAVAAQWFTDFLGRPARLARFDPDHKRLSDLQWTGGIEAPNQFADGYPLLVAGTASLDSLNERLAKAGQAPVGMQRFRPNIVLDGLGAHDEDRVDELRVGSEPAAVLKLVKPCARCAIPDVDPQTGERNARPVSDALQAYRQDARVDGAVTFAMNAIVLEGEDAVLRVGQPVSGRWKFD